MPSHLHEVLIEMFRERPMLAGELLSGPLRVAIPEYQAAHVSSGDLTDVAPTEYRADAVITLDGDGAPACAVVVEVQLRIDRRKRQTWPAYVATLHTRLCCPVVLLVVCPDQAVAEWCGVPIIFGPPGNVVTPVVLGPSQVPVVTDVETARRLPELAVMSAIAHGSRPDPTAIFAALLIAFEVIDLDHAALYTDLVLAALPEAARDQLEDILTTTSHRYQSEFANRYFSQGEAKGLAEGEAKGLAEGEAKGLAEGEAKGLAEGEAKAVLAILRARGIAVPDEIHQRITSCTDLAQLDAWIDRAATADKIGDLDD